jgi:uncharacterized protein
MKAALLSLLRALALGLLTVVLLLVGCQQRLIYHPRGYDEDEVAWIEARGGKRWEVMTSQGKQTAFYLPPLAAPTEVPEFLWLVTGGNGSLALNYATHHTSWDKRFGYLFIDYPGYGLCEGSPSPEHIRETIAALRVKARTEWPLSDADLSARSGALGHSIGAAAALIAAEEWQLTRAVLCTPFTTLTDMARRLVGTPLCYLNRHRFDNQKTLRSLELRQGRAVLIHGTRDEVIPFQMSAQLHAEFPGSTQLITAEGAMHNDIFHLAERQIAEAMSDLAGLP